MNDLPNGVPLSKLVAPTQEQAQITWKGIALAVVIGLFMWALFGFATLGVFSLILGKW